MEFDKLKTFTIKLNLKRKSSLSKMYYLDVLISFLIAFTGAFFIVYGYQNNDIITMALSLLMIILSIALLCETLTFQEKQERYRYKEFTL